MIISQDAISSFDKHYRTHFVNSLPGFKSANLVGTRDSKGTDNVAIMSSGMHLGSHPPLIGLVIRPLQREGGTLDNILNTEKYTLNHIHSNIAAAAHQTSARYPGNDSEFDHTDLTQEFINGFHAPFVAESRIKMALSLADHKPIELNDTHFIIGQLDFVVVDEGCILEDGYIDLEHAGTLTISGLDSYHKTGRKARFAYAKPNKLIESI